MLPDLFLQRMQALLAEEYPAFLREVSKETGVKGLRVNTRKTAAASLLSHFPGRLTPIPYIEGGFYTDEEKPGRLPLHHAGAFYMQDPSAMATVTAAAPSPDFRVLDLCAAPGGKATQLAACLTGEGYLVANEFVPSRCKTLVGNMERMGIPNAVVLNTDVFRIKKYYPDYFDLVLVDAPCSGEGMLRKYAVAGEEWSEENVALSAKRQAELLLHAADTVKKNGHLLYSTCTFSLEENEKNIDAFLEKRRDFRLVPVASALLPHTRAGLRFPGCQTPNIEDCRRFYPHVSPGEGQFFALLQRTEGREAETPAFRDAKSLPKKEVLATCRAFLRENMENPDRYTVYAVGERLMILPPALPVPPERVFLAGVALGEIRKGVLFPHHQFFSACGQDMKRRLCLSSDSPDAARYLAGEEIDAPLENGYCAVLIDGVPTGGAKVSSHRAKNHYPKGLRH